MTDDTATSADLQEAKQEILSAISGLATGTKSLDGGLARAGGRLSSVAERLARIDRKLSQVMLIRGIG